MDKLSHNNRAGVETILLTIITEGPKLFTVGGSQPFRRSGAHLDDTMIHPPVINYNQATAKIYRRGHGDKNISLGSMESSTEVQRG